jgi:hypothetical protein
MFLYQKINGKIKKPSKNKFFFNTSLSIVILLFTITCNKPAYNKDEPFEIFIKRSSKELCEKMTSCNATFIRTFPKHLQKEVTVETCQESLLIDLEEKLSLHTDSMKLLARACYEKILAANCTQYLALAFGDISCYSLKKESDAVYRKLRSQKKDSLKTK